MLRPGDARLDCWAMSKVAAASMSGYEGEFDSNVALMSRLGLRSSSSPEGTGAANTFAAIRKPLWRFDRPTCPERGQSRHAWFGWAGESHRQRRMRRLQCGRSGWRHIEPGHLPILRALDISGGHAHSASRPACSSIYMADCRGLPPPWRGQYGSQGLARLHLLRRDHS